MSVIPVLDAFRPEVFFSRCRFGNYEFALRVGWVLCGFQRGYVIRGGGLWNVLLLGVVIVRYLE